MVKLLYVDYRLDLEGWHPVLVYRVDEQEVRYALVDAFDTSAEAAKAADMIALTLGAGSTEEL